MASTAAATATMMVRVVVVAAVLLVQCCNLILAARPLLHAAAGDGRGWQLRGHGGGALTIMQARKGPGDHCGGFTSPQHPPCGPPPAP
jgi:hypothetical protein